MITKISNFYFAKIALDVFAISAASVFAFPSAWAAPTIAIVHAEKTFVDDRALWAMQMNFLKKNFLEIDPDLKLVTVQAESLESLETSLQRALSPKDSLSGIILMGHGSPTAYSFTKTATYDGYQLSALVTQAISKLPKTPDFFVYLNGCSMANNSTGVSLLDAFARAIPLDQLSLERIQIIAHKNPSLFTSTLKWNSLDAVLIRFTPRFLKKAVSDPRTVATVLIGVDMILNFSILSNAWLYGTPMPEILSQLNSTIWTIGGIAAAAGIMGQTFSKITRKISIDATGMLVDSESSAHMHLGNSARSCSALFRN